MGAHFTLHSALLPVVTRIPKAIVLAVLLVMLANCATAPRTRALLEAQQPMVPSFALIEDVPFFPQDAYQCGPAALATLLTHSGLEVTPTALTDAVFIPGRKGSLQIELAAAGRVHNRVSYQLEGTMATLLREVAAGNPVLVLQNLGLQSLPQWHFAVVKGFDLQNELVILNSGIYENYELDLSIFERTWSRANNWAVTLLPPEQLPMTASATEYLQALWDFEQTAADPHAVVVAYRAATGKWPTDTYLRMAQANFLLSSSHYQAAIEHYQAVIKADPDFAPAHNNIAYAYAALEMTELALEHASKAVELGGENKQRYQQSLIELQANGGGA